MPRRTTSVPWCPGLATLLIVLAVWTGLGIVGHADEVALPSPAGQLDAPAPPVAPKPDAPVLVTASDGVNYDSYRHRIFIVALGLVVGLGFAGCANQPTLLPTNSQLAAAVAVPEGTSYDSLQRGRALTVTQCANCHRFFFPYEYSPSAWPALVNDMGRRALLTPRQTEDVTRYMVAASRATRCESEPDTSAAASRVADVETVARGRTLAIAKCAQCHRFYQPREYLPAAWPRIIQSMAACTRLTEAELRDIRAYFVESSRQGT